ncbi:MAG: hypothetical protein ACTSYC_01975, partial [Promethearchaeota archaeon]
MKDKKWQNSLLHDYKDGDIVKESVKKEESIGNNLQKCIQELETPNDLKLIKDLSEEIPILKNNLKLDPKFKNSKTTRLEFISDLSKKIIQDLKKISKIQEASKEIISEEKFQTIIKENRETRLVAIQDENIDINQLYL